MALKVNQIANVNLPLADDEKNRHYTNSPIYKAFSPLLLSLKLSGLYYERNKTSSVLPLHSLYSLTVTLAMWIVVIVNLYPLKTVTGVNPDLFALLNGILFYGQCAMNATCLYIASYRQKAFTRFFIGLMNLEKYGGIYTQPHQLRKIAATICYIALLIFVMLMIFNVFLIFATNVMGSLIPRVLVGDSETFYWLRLLKMTMDLYFTACWLLTNCLVMMMGYLIFNECTLYCKSFSMKLDTFGRCQATFENERNRFIEMMRIIKATDRTVSMRQVTSFGCNLVNICVLLYVVCYYPQLGSAQTVLGSYAYALSTSIVDVIVTCSSGILVSRGVSSNVLALSH